MKRTWMVVLLVNLLLSACAPVTAPAPTPAPSATPMSVAVLAPTSTATPTATATPSPTPTDTATPSPTPSPTATATPTPIPTLPPEQVGGLTGVPDPRVTNPELFDLTRPDAPIPQFVNAMRSGGIEVLPEEVLNNLQFISTKADGTPLLDQDGRPFIVAAYNFDPDPNQTGETLEGPIPLFIATQNKKGEWRWNDTIITELLFTEGIKFGFPWENIYNFWARRGVRPPEELIAKYSKISTPAGAFRWDIIFRNEGGKNMTTQVANGAWLDADSYLAFTKENNIDPGAPFIFGRSNGIDSALSPSEIKKNVKTIVSRYKNRIRVWTFNELLDENGNLTFTNEQIRSALSAIRGENGVDPNATIMINLGDIEYNKTLNEKYYRLIQQLMGLGLLKPGDIIGIQGHVGILSDTTPDEIATSLERFINLGLRIRFTELDVLHVRDQSLSSQGKKAYVYGNYIEASLIINEKHPNTVDAIIVYGVTHKTSWLRDYPEMYSDSIYPALLNDDGSPELSYYLLTNRIFTRITGSSLSSTT